jgi:hypothetical protein
VAQGRIEIVLANGLRVIVGKDVDAGALARVIGRSSGDDDPDPERHVSWLAKPASTSGLPRTSAGC